MKAYEYGPRYGIPWQVVLRAAWYISLGRSRSLVADSEGALRAMPVPPIVLGRENMPLNGPFVMVSNHYERTGMWMAWSALTAGNIVGRRTETEVRWVAIREWEKFTMHGISVPVSVLRRVFERAFRVYGIIAMPPEAAPPRERAAAVRQTLSAIKVGSIVGLMPEGTVGRTPVLLPAREGVGTFLLMASNLGAPILPVGLYEERGHLVVRFGAPTRLSVPADFSKSERDHWARDRVMQNIKALVPQALWGEYLP